MLPPPFHNALVLTGPTGSGKTALALSVARRLDAEIVAMDSMTLYRHMEIGTAKPTPEERRQVPHHLIDVLEPWESASVACWLKEAARCCQDIEARGKQVLFVGGTPLYLKALVKGLFEGPPADEELRGRLTAEAEEHGTQVLLDRLAKVDPASAARLHVNDRKRIIRALEVYELTGTPISAWQKQWQEDEVPSTEYRVQSSEDASAERSVNEDSAFLIRGTRYSVLGTVPSILWLDLPRPELYERIDRRVDAMFAAGLVEEARALRTLEKPLSREAGMALGYREVFAYLDEQAGLEETIARVKTRSRNLAKRQITWFRHLPGCRPATSELTQALWQPKMKG